MSTKEVWIDRNTALKLLEHNDCNRPISEGRWRNYSAIMVAKNWRPKGAVIRLARGTRSIMNGQHTLLAIADSNTRQLCIVIDDCDPEDFAYLDVSPPRSPADIIAILDRQEHRIGEQDPKRVAAVARSVFKMKRRDFTAGGWKHNPKSYDIVETLRSEPEIPSALAFVGNRFGAFESRSVVAFWFYMLRLANPERAAEFMELLLSGLTTSSPIVKLRDQLLTAHASTRARVQISWVTQMTFKSWNKWYRGDHENLKYLRIRRSGPQSEYFVYPVGVPDDWYLKPEPRRPGEKDATAPRGVAAKTQASGG